MTVLVAVLCLAVGGLAWWVHQLTMQVADNLERIDCLNARMNGLLGVTREIADTMGYLTGRPVEDILPHHEAPSVN